MGNVTQKLNNPLVKQFGEVVGHAAKEQFGPQVKQFEDNLHRANDVRNFVSRFSNNP
jgi:hypothetical protein